MSRPRLQGVAEESCWQRRKFKFCDRMVRKGASVVGGLSPRGIAGETGDVGSEVGRTPGAWGVPQVTRKREEHVLGRETEIHRSWSGARLGRVFWVLMMWEHTWGGAGS